MHQEYISSLAAGISHLLYPAVVTIVLHILNNCTNILLLWAILSLSKTMLNNLVKFSLLSLLYISIPPQVCHLYQLPFQFSSSSKSIVIPPHTYTQTHTHTITHTLCLLLMMWISTSYTVTMSENDLPFALACPLQWYCWLAPKHPASWVVSCYCAAPHTD